MSSRRRSATSSSRGPRWARSATPARSRARIFTSSCATGRSRSIPSAGCRARARGRRLFPRRPRRNLRRRRKPVEPARIRAPMTTLPPPPPERPHAQRRGRLPRFLWLSLCATLGGYCIAGVAAAKDPAGPYRKLDVFSHVLSLIENNYVEPVDDTRLLYGAVDGMVRTLDPHSSFMDPRSYAALKEETEGEYGGVGLELATRGEDVVVVAPIDDTPASRAGFQPGDRLTEIDGRAVHGWRENEAVRALTGSPGTKVTVKAHRAGWAEPRSFTLVRDVIRIVSVEEKLFDRKLAYVKVKSFQDRTRSE